MADGESVTLQMAVATSTSSHSATEAEAVLAPALRGDELLPLGLAAAARDGHPLGSAAPAVRPVEAGTDRRHSTVKELTRRRTA